MTTLVLSIIVLAVCLIGGFVAWMVYFHRAGKRAIRQENRQQEREGERPRGGQRS